MPETAPHRPPSGTPRHPSQRRGFLRMPRTARLSGTRPTSRGTAGPLAQVSTALIVGLAALVAAAPAAGAAGIAGGTAGVLSATAPGGIGAVTSFAARLTDYVTAVAASIAVLFIAINGLRWTGSGGNPSRQADAKTGLTAAVVGLAVAVSANLIVNLVLAALK